MSLKLKLAIVVVGLIVALPHGVRADIAVPDNPPARRGDQEIVPIAIVFDTDARAVRLQIPGSMLDEPQASTSAPNVRTLFAGFAMSIAMGCMVFVKRGNRFVRGTVVSAFGLAALFTVTGALQADMPAPYRWNQTNRDRRSLRQQVEKRAEVLLPAGIRIDTDAICEVIPNLKQITLILPSRLQSKVRAANEDVVPEAPSAPAEFAPAPAPPPPS